MAPMAMPMATGAQLNNGAQILNPYGGVPDAKKVKTVFPHQRRRMNLVAICQSLFVPWLLFCTLFAVQSFWVKFDSPGLCNIYAGVALFLSLACAFMAYAAHSKKQKGLDADPSWYGFLFLSMMVAWVLAMVLGDMNYTNTMRQYYDIYSMNSYNYVDVETERGAGLMDAGRVVFKEGTVLDLKRSIGFKNLDTYCVAPITAGPLKPLASYDYWAVGINCCSSTTSDFRCGESGNPFARGGLRLMKDEQRPFLRLAVQQAQSTYQIEATHPLFFHWMQDPDTEFNDLRDEGFKFFALGMFAHFAFNLVCVGLAISVFSKIGYH
jgi:hypothetical protein